MTSPSTKPVEHKDAPEPKDAPKRDTRSEGDNAPTGPDHPEPVSHLHDTPRPVVGETATEINERHAREALEGAPVAKEE